MWKLAAGKVSRLSKLALLLLLLQLEVQRVFHRVGSATCSVACLEAGDRTSHSLDYIQSRNS